MAPRFEDTSNYPPGRSVGALDLRAGDRVHNIEHGPLTVEGQALNRRGASRYNRVTLRTEDGRRTVVNFPEGASFWRLD